jgi:hypothetical protein
MNHTLIDQQRAGKTDGQLHRVEPDDIAAGTVLRMVHRDGTSGPFSDFTILDEYWVDKAGIRVRPDDEDDRHDRRHVVMARPYLWTTGVGTACPSALTGVETLTVEAGQSLLSEGSIFRTVCTARGAVHTFVK